MEGAPAALVVAPQAHPPEVPPQTHTQKAAITHTAISGLGSSAVWAHQQIPSTEIELGEMVGRGGQGCVHAGYWLGTRVALKVMRIVEERTQELLLREAAILASLRHPCICQFFGTSPLDGQVVCVMELLHVAVSEVLGRVHANAELSHQIAHETAMGVAYLHRSNVLHRDIKAANVMLDQTMHAKVCDFGLAKLFTAEQQESATLAFEGAAADATLLSATQHSATAGVGTLRYVAPEVLEGFFEMTVHYTEAADVYSFGLLLWELTHGEIAFRDHQGLQVAITKAPRGERPSLSLPKNFRLERLIASCWHQLPAQRPTMAECVEILSLLRREQPGVPGDEDDALGSAAGPVEASDG